MATVIVLFGPLPLPEGVGDEVKDQLVFPPPLTLLKAVMAVAFESVLSDTEAYCTFLIPWGSINHAVPGTEEASVRRLLPLLPVSTIFPWTVFVFPAEKVRLAEEETAFVRL